MSDEFENVDLTGYPFDISNINNFFLHKNCIPINYSQIYNDLKMPAASPAQQEPKNINIPQSEKNVPEINKTPYNFQSATDMRTSLNKKNLPGVIVSTPHSQSRNVEIPTND